MASSTDDPASQEAELPDTGVIAESLAAEVHAEPTMLDAVTAVLEGESGPEVTATSKTGEAEGESKPAAEGEGKPKDDSELSELDLSRLQLRTQKRIRELVKESKQSEAKVAEFEPKAKAYDTITNQIQATGLDKDDLGVTFDIATSLKRGDAFRARELLTPIWNAVNRATGGILPDDLAQEAREGKISVARAQEIAVARAAANQAASQGRVSRERQNAQAEQQLREGAITSVNEWERVKAASDPDWALKAEEIDRSLRYEILKGNRPKSPAEAVAMAEKALTEVNARLSRYRPAPKAVRAVVSGGSGSSRNSDPAPKNTRDIINSFV